MDTFVSTNESPYNGCVGVCVTTLSKHLLECDFIRGPLAKEVEGPGEGDLEVTDVVGAGRG